MGLILLERGKALACHQVGALPAAVAQVLCRAKVQQHQLVLRRDHEVVGLDVAVDDAARVHLFQIADNRLQQIQAALFRERPVPHQAGPQGLALGVVHGDVGRLVFKEHAPNAHHMAQIAQLHRLAGFLHEALPPGLETLGVFARAPVDLAALVCRAHGGSLGVILLDTDLELQVQVPADVADAEAALAQHPADHIVPGKHRPAGQRVVRLAAHVPGIVIAAMAAAAAGRRQLAHTAVAAVKYHSDLLQYCFTWF